MADQHLPSVPAPEAGAGRSGPGAAEGAWPGRPAFVLLSVILAAGSILTLGLASLVGESVRRAVLVEVDGSLLDSQPSYSDAPSEAAVFFARRDSVRVRVPRDMTVAEFLALYHLETSIAARDALRDQLGAVVDGDVLREGDRVTLTLTLPRVGR